MQKYLSTSFALSLFALSACSSSSERPTFDEEADRIEGIYRVTKHTLNTSACSLDGGASQPDTDTYAFAKRGNLFGANFLSVYSCASPADCRDKIAKLDSMTGFNIDFEFTVSAVELRGMIGGGTSTGFLDGDVCTDGQVWTTTLELADDDLRIEREITVADDYRATNKTCTTEQARTAAAGNACSQMEVLTATFLESL